jgi:alpha-methylacyl-CoA racemase
VARIIAARDLDDWADCFRETDACVEPLRTPAEAFLHPQAVHRGAEAAAPPWPFGGEPSRRLGPPPALGEHTEALLREAGLTPEAIGGLRDEGVC